MYSKLRLFLIIGLFFISNSAKCCLTNQSNELNSINSLKEIECKIVELCGKLGAEENAECQKYFFQIMSNLNQIESKLTIVSQLESSYCQSQTKNFLDSLEKSLYTGKWQNILKVSYQVNQKLERLIESLKEVSDMF